MSRDRLPGLIKDFHKISYKGQYLANELYQANDVVLHQNLFWIFTFDTPNSNVEPTTPSTFWKDLSGETTVQRGLLSQRAIASINNRGRFYFATDATEQRLYFSTGVDWQLCGVPVPATMTRSGLVKVNTNDADPVVYRKQEIDTLISTQALTATNATVTNATATNLTVLSSVTVPTLLVTNTSTQAANTLFVNNFLGSRFKDVVNGRLSLSSTSNEIDITSSSIIYFNSCHPNRPEQISNKGLIGLYIDGAWRLVEFTAVSLSIASLSAGTAHDVFVELNTSTQQLVLTTRQWTNVSTRVALHTHEGVLVHSSTSLNKRYVGSFLVSGAGVTTDRIDARYVFNFYNRIQKRVYSLNTSGGLTYTYNVATWTQATYSPLIFIFSGMSSSHIDLRLLPQVVFCNISVGSLPTYQYISASVNDAAASVQITGQPTIHTASIYMQPSMVELSGYGLLAGKYIFKVDILSANPGAGNNFTFLPYNSYLGGFYRC